MIDVMAIQQSHERRELAEIRWINGDDYPADTMIKSKANSELAQLVRNNRLQVRVEGWVQRKEKGTLGNTDMAPTTQRESSSVGM